MEKTNFKIVSRKGLFSNKPKYFTNSKNMYKFIDLQFSLNKIDYVEVFKRNENNEFVFYDTHDN